MKGNLRNTKRVPPNNNRIVEVAGARKKMPEIVYGKDKNKESKIPETL